MHRRLAEQRLSHDELTGLLNKQGLENELENNSRHGAVIYVDISNLKAVNDTFGHAIGDDVIKLSAELIRKSTRVDDLLARVHGDEFIIFAYTDYQGNGNRKDNSSPTEQAEALIARIGANTTEILIEKPYLKKAGFNLAAGYSLWKPGRSIEETINAADLNMLQDKIEQHKSVPSYRTA